MAAMVRNNRGQWHGLPLTTTAIVWRTIGRGGGEWHFIPVLTWARWARVGVLAHDV
jgi:hypothetical protein